MKNDYATALAIFAWILIIAGAIVGIYLIIYSTGRREYPFRIFGVAFIFASLFNGVLYLTIAKISSDISEEAQVGRKKFLYPIWYQKWGIEIANAMIEGTLIEDMTKEQIVESLGSPDTIFKIEDLELLQYETEEEYLRYWNILLSNGKFVNDFNSLEKMVTFRKAFNIRLGMSIDEVKDMLGKFDDFEKKKKTVGDEKKEVSCYKYLNVLRSLDSEPTTIELYFDPDTKKLIGEKS